MTNRLIMQLVLYFSGFSGRFEHPSEGETAVWSAAVGFMAVSFTLEQSLNLDKDLAEKVKSYLLGGDREESRECLFLQNLAAVRSRKATVTELIEGHKEDLNFVSDRFVKRSVSTSSDEADQPDSEQPAGVRDWEFTEQVAAYKSIQIVLL